MYGGGRSVGVHGYNMYDEVYEFMEKGEDNERKEVELDKKLPALI